MSQRKVPMRMCIGCREKKPKRELVRVVRSQEGRVFVDPTGRAAGRGAYLCVGSAPCLQRAVKSKLLEKNLETRIDGAVYEELLAQLKGEEDHDAQA